MKRGKKNRWFLSIEALNTFDASHVDRLESEIRCCSTSHWPSVRIFFASFVSSNRWRRGESKLSFCDDVEFALWPRLFSRHDHPMGNILLCPRFFCFSFTVSTDREHEPYCFGLTSANFFASNVISFVERNFLISSMAFFTPQQRCNQERKIENKLEIFSSLCYNCFYAIIAIHFVPSKSFERTAIRCDERRNDRAICMFFFCRFSSFQLRIPWNYIKCSENRFAKCETNRN